MYRPLPVLSRSHHFFRVPHETESHAAKSGDKLNSFYFRGSKAREQSASFDSNRLKLHED